MATRYAENVVLDERLESPASEALIVHIRSIEATDTSLLREFMRSLSVETRYLRFMSTIKELSAPALARLTRVDHRRDTALVAVVNTNGVDRAVGVARYALNGDGESCDFAIVVADDWRRRGLGSRLLSLILDTASARGLKRIGGDVLAINEPMKAFAKSHGFTLSRSNDGPTLVRVERRLDYQRA